MCGILGIFGHAGDSATMRDRALVLSRCLRHRGPDWSGVAVVKNNILCHERLAIVDVDSGAQPLTGGPDDAIVLCVNGEIYNHKSLKKGLATSYSFKTASDCEVIIPLYLEHGEDFVSLLDGDFAFILYDGRSGSFMAARDAMGVTTLYQGWARDGSVWFASEMKALHEDCEQLTKAADTPLDLAPLREHLEASVVKRLMTDVPYGILLSGGLDSSLIASIAQRHASRRVEDDERSEAWWPRLHTFSVGLTGAPDLGHAKEVAKFLGTVHHEYNFTVQEGLDAVRDVIYHLETYDVTTVRASVPMYLLSRKIRATGVKMVLSGEGADEIFGGYLYFHQAPSATEFHKESVDRVKNLQYADNLRANKSTMAWGLECRVPFLDKAFLDVAMSVDPAEKMCTGGRMEKYILRQAFATAARPYLPDSVLWRQKEQFSDGVGYAWIDTLKASATAKVTDAEMAAAKIRFPHNTPDTKEAYYYRHVFAERFPQPTCATTVKKWVPRADWGCHSDPSGRVQKVHHATTLQPPASDGSEPRALEDGEGRTAKRPKAGESTA